MTSILRSETQMPQRNSASFYITNKCHYS